MNQFFPSISTYHRTNNSLTHEYEQNLSSHFSPCDLYTEHLTNQNLYMFGNDTFMTSNEKSTSTFFVRLTWKPFNWIFTIYTMCFDKSKMFILSKRFSFSNFRHLSKIVNEYTFILSTIKCS